MKLATYLKQRAREKGVEVSDLTMPSAAVDNAVVQETTPISAPAEPMHPAPQVQQPVAPLEPVAAPAPVLALTPEELEARKRELLRRQTEYAQAHSLPTAGDARQYCKPGMAPAAPAP